jgi:glutathione peroxidase
LITRRTAIAAAAGLAASPASAQPQAASQPAARNAYAFAFEGIDGREIALRQFAGRPFMVVNTASRCGFTGQYEGLQQIWSRYRQRGFTVVGVPSNDFAGQEPGSNDEILGFCSQTYGVTFPLAAKARVLGDGAHPFYRWAATERPADRPRWNFHKYLLGRDGRIAAVFATSTKPTDPQVIAGIERTLSGPSPAS